MAQKTIRTNDLTPGDSFMVAGRVMFHVQAGGQLLAFGVDGLNLASTVGLGLSNPGVRPPDAPGSCPGPRPQSVWPRAQRRCPGASSASVPVSACGLPRF